MVYPALLPLMRTPRLPVDEWTDAPRRFKWTRPFRRKAKSSFCACAITFQLASTFLSYYMASGKTKSCRNSGTYFEFCAWSYKKDVVRACPSIWTFRHCNTEHTACVVVQLFGKRDYKSRSILYYSGRMFLILTPFSLIKSVKNFGVVVVLPWSPACMFMEEV